MKLGGPPVRPGLGTEAVTPVVQVPGSQPRAGSTPQHAAPSAADTAPMPAKRQARHPQSSFKPTGSHRQRSTQAVPARDRPQPRRPADRSVADEGRELDGTVFGAASDDDGEARRLRFGYALRGAEAQHGDAESGNDDEGGRQERRFQSMRMTRGTSKALASAEPLALRLRAAVQAAQTVEDVAALMRELARGALGPTEATGLSTLLMGVAMDWLAREGPDAPGGISTLASLRAALVEDASSAATDARPSAACIWLPVFLLHLDRPRRPADRLRAHARLALLVRGMTGSDAG